MFEKSECLTIEQENRIFGNVNVQHVSLLKDAMGVYIWSGDTENSFFKITLLMGILRISLEDREMNLIHNLVHVGNVAKQTTEEVLPDYKSADEMLYEIFRFVGWKMKENLEILDLTL